jgi:hypothetical protein
MAQDNDESRRNAERVGRGVKEGMNGGVSRNAHTQGENRDATESPELRRSASANDAGEGGYGDSSGFTGGTSAPRDTGATSARTRTDDVGRQAESGMETDPDAGARGTSGGARVTEDMREQGDGADGGAGR